MEEKNRHECGCEDCHYSQEKHSEHCNCEENCNCGCKDGKECICEDDCKCHEHKHKDKKHEKNKYKEEIERLKADNKRKESEVLIAKADLINYRKRKDEEVTRLLKFCNEDLIKQILPIMDNFERATKIDANSEFDKSKFLEGFKMIYSNMQSVMENFEVRPIEGTDIPFDPVYHNAILVEHRDGVESGMVLEVLQKGYIYKDKVIRPAVVKVSE